MTHDQAETLRCQLELHDQVLVKVTEQLLSLAAFVPVATTQLAIVRLCAQVEQFRKAQDDLSARIGRAQRSHH